MLYIMCVFTYLARFPILVLRRSPSPVKESLTCSSCTSDVDIAVHVEDVCFMNELRLKKIVCTCHFA